MLQIEAGLIFIRLGLLGTRIRRFLLGFFIVESGGFFFGVAFVVEFEEALEDFLAGCRADGVAGAIVLGEVVEIVEAVAEAEWRVVSGQWGVVSG